MAAAVAAGDLLLERFRRPATGVERKSSSTDMVSDADRDAEALIRSLIGERRPGDAVLGEEGGRAAGAGDLLWVVDPLDGTTNYLYRQPVWAVSVACEDAEGGVAGVVHHPCLGETFTAVRGGGAFCNGAPIAVSACGDLSRSLIGTGFSYSAEVRAGQARALNDILPRVRDVRRAGSAAIDLAWVACGRLDGYYELWHASLGPRCRCAAGVRGGRRRQPADAGGGQRRRGAGGRAGTARGSRRPRGIRAATLNAPSGAACHGARFTRMAPTA